jgi:hypothetical protein
VQEDAVHARIAAQHFRGSRALGHHLDASLRLGLSQQTQRRRAEDHVPDAIGDENEEASRLRRASIHSPGSCPKRAVVPPRALEGAQWVADVGAALADALDQRPRRVLGSASPRQAADETTCSAPDAISLGRVAACFRG